MRSYTVVRDPCDWEQDNVLHEQPRFMQKWEYLRVIVVSGMITRSIEIFGNVDNNIDRTVEKSWCSDHTLMSNHFGNQGWELVSHSEFADHHEYHFKRPLNPAPSPPPQPPPSL